MSPFTHLAVSSALGGALWMGLKSFPAGLACLLSGVLLDLDHLLDYVYNHGWRLRPMHFLKTFKNDILSRIIILLHSWELAPLAVLAVWRTGWTPVGIGLLTGALTHLALDQIFNRHNPWAYFLIYRIYHRFASRPFYGQEEYQCRLRRQRECDSSRGGSTATPAFRPDKSPQNLEEMEHAQ